MHSDKALCKMMMVGVVLLLVWSTLGLVGCGHSSTERLSPDDEVIIDTYVSSADLRSMSQRMARSLIQVKQVAQAVNPPRIAFLELANRTEDEIDSYNLLSQIRTLLIKHSQGRVIFLDRERIDAINRERDLKRRGSVGSSGEKILSGVDFFLTGRAYSLTKRFEGATSTYYRFSFRLTDAESGDIIWEDEYEFKKAGRTSIMYR